MTEFITLLTIMSTVIIIFVAACARLDAKDNRKERARIDDAWEKFYKESRKYKAIKTVVVTYADGDEESIEGATSYNTDDHFLYLLDKHDKAIRIINKQEVVEVKIIRSDNYTDGRRCLND